MAVPGVTIQVAQSLPAGSFTPPGGPPVANMPPFCRVAGVIKPTADSNIQFEVWMPGSGWNGKFQGIGNGGFAGAIGFGVDGGGGSRTAMPLHPPTRGTRGGGTDATWALGHPEKVVDFGYRAIHETTEKAKAIVAAFYGEGPKRSYFSSCSNGGRQALMEAQRFPADYDGIIAGAPANYWTHLLTGALWDRSGHACGSGQLHSRRQSAGHRSRRAGRLRRAGWREGRRDRRSRRTVTSILRCCCAKDADSSACLTAPQVAALKKIYAGPHNSKGKQVIPGYSPGGEAGGGGWPAWITGRGPEKSLLYAFGTQFFTNMVYNNAAWDWRDVHRRPRHASRGRKAGAGDEFDRPGFEASSRHAAES